MRVRTTAAALTALLTMAAAASGCGASSDDGGSGGAKAPLKIALIPPNTGALAVFGGDAAKGWQLAADEANARGGVDGHRVELKTYDTDGSPAATLRAARTAATRDGTRFIGAVITSPEHAALQAQLSALGAVSIGAIATDDPLTGAQCSANAVRVVPDNAMYMSVIARTLPKLPVRRWAILAMDYSTGHTAARTFAGAAKAAGQPVVATEYAALGTKDFGSAIAKLKASGADGLFAFEAGADAVAFVNQGAQFKVFDRLKTVIGYNMVAEPLFAALGDKAVGFYNNTSYDRSWATPANRAFVKAYTQRFGAAPYYVPADQYVAAQALFAAVRKAGSVDPAEVRAALGGLKYPTLDGAPAEIRPEDHQGLRTAYLAQVVRTSGGGLGWKTVASEPASITTPAADPACRLAAARG